MSGIEADRDSLRRIHLHHDVGHVFQLVAKTASLPGRVFQSDPDGRYFRRGENFIESGDNLADPRRFAGTEVRAGMQHEERNSQIGRELNFLNERLD